MTDPRLNGPWIPEKGDQSTGDISGDSDVDTAWLHTPFWSGRHIKGEFSSQYPYSGYSIHVFAGDEEVGFQNDAFNDHF